MNSRFRTPTVLTCTKAETRCPLRLSHRAEKADRGRQLFSISVHELVKRLVGQAAAALDLKRLDIV